MGESENENASHEDLLEAVALGHAAILSDEDLPGGRFQIAAVVMSGEFVITKWRQDADGNWNSYDGCVLLKRDAATRLIGLLHTAGYAMPLAAVK